MEHTTDNAKVGSSWVLDLEALKSCDIILSRDGSWLSKTIRWGSGGEYSHAMLYLPVSIIHARKPGVFSYNPQRLFSNGEEDFCVLRFAGLNDEQQKKIEEFARSKVGSLYSIREATSVVLNRDAHSAKVPDKQFCSRFVAQAFEAAKISLLPNSCYCAPGDFVKSSKLIRVDGATRPATEIDVRRINSFDFVTSNREHTFAWLSEARKYSGDIATVNDAVRYVVNDRVADEKTARAMAESGYLEDWKADKVAHEYRYDAKLLYMLIKMGKTDIMLETRALTEYAERIFLELIDIRALARRSQSKVVKLLACLYENLLRDVCERMQVLSQVMSICGYIIPGVCKLVFLYTKVLDGSEMVKREEVAEDQEEIVKEDVRPYLK